MKKIMQIGFLCVTCLCVLGVSAVRSASSSTPLAPKDEQATIRTLPGFQVELVACEPDVIDPVAMAFDEQGRMFVVEMIGYPHGGIAIGKETRGVIKMLEDKDGDGYFETCTTYAEGLRFPTGVMPYKGGLIVANAPDLIHISAPGAKPRVLYTGFNLENIQQLVNSLQWGLDNWVYGCAGIHASEVTCPEKPDMKPVTLRGRGIRFKPDVPGSLEPTSNGGQYGLTSDAFGHWFTTTNAQHLRQVVLPDHYLRRNSYLSVPAVTLDIPDHGAACKVFRISPFEPWRVERTNQRLVDPRFKTWPAEEKVPGGFVTSGCSPVIYLADRYPPQFRGNSFMCDPANNVVHRDRLERNGPATFVAKRADENCEFLASTDNWFRPVWLTLGPDGTLYVCDFYREVIETPLSLPEDIKKRYNLESRGRGRIWRIVPDDGKKMPRPNLGAESPAELVKHLSDDNYWWRINAQRLLVERQDKSVVPALESLARSGAAAPTRVHALHTLAGIRSLTPDVIGRGAHDDDAEVRVHSLQLSESDSAIYQPLLNAILSAVDDPAPQVRFQAAYSLGALAVNVAAPLATLLSRDGADPWLQGAALSSAGRIAPDLLATLIHDPAFLRVPHSAGVLTQLATVIGGHGDDASLVRAFSMLAGQPDAATWPVAVLDGLGQGLQNGKRSLRKLWEQPPPALAEAVKGVLPIFKHAAVVAADPKAALAERATALRRLGYGPFAVGVDALAAALGPENPPQLQAAAVQALSAHDNPKIADMILEHWEEFGPAVRGEAVEALCARPARLTKLLDAIEAKRIAAGQIESPRRQQTLRIPNAAIRKRAADLFANAGNPDRKKVIEEYIPALELKADTARGQQVFARVCSTCHKLGDLGHDVGPDLHAALGNKTKDALIIDILDPNREVDPRFVNYQVTTKAGRMVTGLLAVETPASVTLRRADKAEDTILRAQIESMAATRQSLMPEELEKQLTKQDLADVIAYLLTQAKPQ
jgi:putative membrane-bound dehydrogenase-like protein